MYVDFALVTCFVRNSTNLGYGVVFSCEYCLGLGPCHLDKQTCVCGLLPWSPASCETVLTSAAFRKTVRQAEFVSATCFGRNSTGLDEGKEFVYVYHAQPEEERVLDANGCVLST